MRVAPDGPGGSRPSGRCRPAGAGAATRFWRSGSMSGSNMMFVDGGVDGGLRGYNGVCTAHRRAVPRAKFISCREDQRFTRTNPSVVKGSKSAARSDPHRTGPPRPCRAGGLEERAGQGYRHRQPADDCTTRRTSPQLSASILPVLCPVLNRRACVRGVSREDHRQRDLRSVGDREIDCASRPVKPKGSSRNASVRAIPDQSTSILPAALLKVRLTDIACEHLADGRP